MKKVKSEYEKCTVNYNSIMTRINQQQAEINRQRAEQELRAIAASTVQPATSTDKSSKHFTVSSIKTKRQREAKETATSTSQHHQNSSSTSSDNGSEQIKTVCW
jgi:hypothetical protein